MRWLSRLWLGNMVNTTRTPHPQDQLMNEYQARWFLKLHEFPQQEAISNTCTVLWNYFPFHSPVLRVLKNNMAAIGPWVFTQQLPVSLGASLAHSKLAPGRILLLFQNTGDHQLDTRVRNCLCHPIKNKQLSGEERGLFPTVPLVLRSV